MLTLHSSLKLGSRGRGHPPAAGFHVCNVVLFVNKVQGLFGTHFSLEAATNRTKS